MTHKQKALWLQQNYHNYTLSWYLSDTGRLDALYRREYRAFLNKMNSSLNHTRQRELDSEAERMKSVYQKVYGTDYDLDIKSNRLETFRKVMAVTEMWVVPG